MYECEIQHVTCYITIITELNFILRNNCTYCGGDLEDMMANMGGLGGGMGGMPGMGGAGGGMDPA